jgi:hypothetical protein
MFRAILASGFAASLGLFAPAQAQSQHYQPGFPLVYYHPVPAAPVYPAHPRHHSEWHGPQRYGFHGADNRFGQPVHAFRSVNRGGVYLEVREQPRPVRPATRFYAYEDRPAYAERPYGYAYRPRPNARNSYSSAYREDQGSWRTRRDGIVVVHPRGPVIRPVPPSGDALVVPGRSGALVVTGSRNVQPSRRTGPVDIVRPQPDGRRYRTIQPE